jgi:hypothetical protein
MAAFMTAVLSPITIDPLGGVRLECLPTSRLGLTERRVNRVKTLDGGYAINDYGSSQCDRDIRLVWTADTTKDSAAARLVEWYGELYLALREGFFRVAPQSIETRAAETTLELLVLERLTDPY